MIEFEVLSKRAGHPPIALFLAKEDARLLAEAILGEVKKVIDR